MTRYKEQTDFDEDCSSLGSGRTEEMSSGATRVRYHMGSNFWRSRTNLEKALVVICLLLLVTLVALVAVIASRKDSIIPSILLHTHDSSDNSLCMRPECVSVAASILSRMNLSASPCHDFYNYACGRWLDSAIKPEGKPAWGTLGEVTAENQVIMRKALESDVPVTSEAEKKARLFYRSCVDANNTVEKRGARPLLYLLSKAGGWALLGNDWNVSDFDLESEIVRSQVDFNSGALFSWLVAENDKKSNEYIIQFDQGGLMLPTRNFYLNESERDVTDAYVKYITKVGVLLGASEKESEISAKDVLSIETNLANFSAPEDERRDDEKLYNNMTLEELTTLAPFMNWTHFVNRAFQLINESLESSEKVVVYAPDYLSKVTQYLDDLKDTERGNISIHNYLTWHIVKNHVMWLSRDFHEALTTLEKAQVGIAGAEDVWRQCVAATDAAIGPPLGAMFVKRAFPEKARTMASKMLFRIRGAFGRSLDEVVWMDNTTKTEALKKAEHIYDMIGYPDYILNANELDTKFLSLELDEAYYFENNINVTLFKVKENLSRLFQPVNKTKWDMTPPTVNAYYSPTRNSMVFPAGILQPPLFNEYNPQALNYGAVGVIMGHELSHAFDDQGSQYDKDGNLHSWWQKETKKEFEEKIKCMVDQYSNYSLREEHLKGNLTLGENIADNGGLKASYYAFEDWKKSQKSQIVLPGMNVTDEQLFFIGFAQVWCSTMTNEVAHLQILRDSHVPAEFRVRGSLSNSVEFSRAFKCRLGESMNPIHKCHIW